MNAAFFAGVRASLFGGRLAQGQVDGINELARAWRLYGDGDERKLAYILAGVLHESARMMQPVRETLAESDEQAIARLENAWRAGKLPWVKTPYWRRENGGLAWFGRGRIQNTHKANAEKLEKRFGIGFTKNPDLFLDSKIDAMVTVVGHLEGLWTGKKLGDFIDGPACDFVSARRVVNGTDRAELIAGYAKKFLAAIKAAMAAAPAPPEVSANVPARPGNAASQRENGDTRMTWDTLQQFVRIGLYAGGSFLFGQEVADGDMYQAAIGGALALGAFAWWMVWERGRPAA